MNELDVISNYADMHKAYPEYNWSDEEKLNISKKYYNHYIRNVKIVIDSRFKKGEISLEKFSYENIDVIIQLMQILKETHLIPENKEISKSLLKSAKERIELQLKTLGE